MGLSVFDLPREPYTVELACPKCKKIRTFTVVPAFGGYGEVRDQYYECSRCGKRFKKIVRTELVETTDDLQTG